MARTTLCCDRGEQCEHHSPSLARMRALRKRIFAIWREQARNGDSRAAKCLADNYEKSLNGHLAIYDVDGNRVYDDLELDPQ